MGMILSLDHPFSSANEERPAGARNTPGPGKSSRVKGESLRPEPDPAEGSEQARAPDDLTPLAEPARLAALARAGLLDTAAEPSFDRLTRLAGRVLGVPVALVSLVDADRQFFKSHVGLPEPWAGRRETPLTHSFCQHVVASGEPLAIMDARLDPRVASNLAIPDIGVIAYLGIPIRYDDQVIGSFCAIDDKPRAWSPGDIETMGGLAESVVSEIALRGEHRAALAAQARLVTTLASIGDGVITTDAGGAITFLNPVAEALSGWDNAEAIGRPLATVFRTIDGTSHEPLRNPVEKTLGPADTIAPGDRTTLIARDGIGRPIEDSVAAIRGDDGTVVGRVLVFRDVTEKARVERELADARTRLDAALEAGAIATWTWDIPTDRLVPDANMARLFSIPPGLVGGCPVEHFIAAVHPDDRERVLADVDRSLATGERYEVEYRVVQTDGTIRCVLANSTPTFAPDGSPRTLSGVVVDITARKEVEAEAQRREAQLRLATEAARLGIFTWDAALDRTTWGNVRIYDIFGLAPHEPPLTTEAYARDYSHPDDRATYLEAIAAAARTGRLHFTGRFTRRDGRRRWIEIIGGSGDPLGGTPNNLVGVVADVTERMESSELRRKGEEFQRLVFESVADFSIFTTDLGGRVTSWNRGAENVFGYTEAEAIGMPAAVVFTPEDRAAGVPRQEMQSAAEFGRGLDERWHIRKDGGRFFASGTVRPITDDAGSLIGFTKVARDVTAAKRITDALRRSELRTRIAAESADLGIFEWDAAADRADWLNDRCYEIFGRTREDGPVSLAELRDFLLLPEDVPAIDASMAELARTGRYRYEGRFRRKDGQVRWLTVTGQLEGGDGPSRFLSGTFADVTDRREAVLALHRSRGRYRSLFETIDEGFCILQLRLDEDGRAVDYRFTEINPAFERITRLTDALGRWASEVLPGLDRAWLERYGRIAATGEPERFEMREGSMADRTFACIAFRTGDPGENKVAVLFNDITHRRRAEEQRQELVDQLTDADRRKDEFLAMLAHELRNPLGAISNATHLAQVADDPAQLPELHGTVRDQVRHLTHLIDDLLDVSRITQGKIELRNGVVVLGEVIDRAVALARPQVDEKQHHLSVRVADRSSRFAADPTRVEQMLSNLLTNAAKYSEPGRAIDLSAGVEGGGVVFRVRDEGHGISAEMLPRIFGLFEQVVDQVGQVADLVADRPVQLG